jgi:RNA polymerase sigma-70 factor (ECF subfamily)
MNGDKVHHVGLDRRPDRSRVQPVAALDWRVTAGVPMARFDTTRWSLIVAARADTRTGRDALDHLCRAYRPPVVAFLARSARSRDDAEDLAQGFFARFLEKRLHEVAAPERGSFRAFLRSALQNYAAHVHEAATAQRRGGGQRHEVLDADPAHEAASPDLSPEDAFELSWALTVLDRAMGELAREAEQSGKRPLFEALREFVVEQPEADDYRRVAERLELRENTVAVAVHRLRKRLRELVHAELAETVSEPEAVEPELRALRAVLKQAR